MSLWTSGTITIGYDAMEYYKERKINNFRRKDVDWASRDIRDLITLFMRRQGNLTSENSNFEVVSLPYFSSSICPGFSYEANKSIDSNVKLYFNVTFLDMGSSAEYYLNSFKDLLNCSYRTHKLLPEYSQFSINDGDGYTFFSSSRYLEAYFYKQRFTESDELYLKYCEKAKKVVDSFNFSITSLKRDIYGYKGNENESVCTK